MPSSYADFSQVLALYGLFPYITAYLSYVAYGVYAIKGNATDVSQRSTVTSRHTSLDFMIPLYLSFWLPVFIVFCAYRGLDCAVLTAAGTLLSCNLKWVLILLIFFAANLTLLLLRRSSYGQSYYALEVFYSYAFLYLAWFFVSLSSSVLTFLLALEVVTLLLLLLMCNLGLFGNFGCSSLRGSVYSSTLMLHQAQYSLVSVVLAFVWVMGFATIFFLWAVALSFPTFNSIDFFYIGLVELNWGSLRGEGFIVSSVLSGGWLGFALLFKLVLQPFQTFLTVFYKQVPPIILLGYFQFYYVLVLFFIFFFVITPFGFITLSWHWVVFAYVAGSSASLLVGQETLRDIGTVLAYSTFVNISFFLLVGGYHAS